MLSYEDLVELAMMCARNAWTTTSNEVAEEPWRMAKEYQAQAAEPHSVSASISVT
jgi:hypothetical protein